MRLKTRCIWLFKKVLKSFRRHIIEVKHSRIRMIKMYVHVSAPQDEYNYASQTYWKTNLKNKNIQNSNIYCKHKYKRKYKGTCINSLYLLQETAYL